MKTLTAQKLSPTQVEIKSFALRQRIYKIGDSGGRATTLGFRERDDLKRMVDFMDHDELICLIDRGVVGGP